MSDKTNKPSETIFIVQKLDSGFIVTSGGKQRAFTQVEAVTSFVTDWLRVLDLTTPHTRREVGYDALKLTIVPVKVESGKC